MSLIITLGLSSARWTTEALKAPAIGCEVLDSRLEPAPGLWSPPARGLLGGGTSPRDGELAQASVNSGVRWKFRLPPKTVLLSPHQQLQTPHHPSSPSSCPKGGPREPCHRAPALKLLRAAENISGWAVRASEAVTSLKTSWKRERERGGGLEWDERR